MKKILSLLCFITSITAHSQQKTLLSGQIKSFEASKIKLKLLKSYIVIEYAEFESEVNSVGDFALSLPLAEAQMAWLEYGGETLGLFLSPGDKLIVNFDTRYPHESLAFAGKGADANNYLAARFLQFDDDAPQWLAQQAAALEPRQFLAYSDSVYRARLRFLDNYERWHGLPRHFVQYEQTSAYYRHLVAKLSYPQLHHALLREQGKRLPWDLPQNYYDFLGGITVMNQAAAQHPDYLQFVEQYLLLRHNGLARETGKESNNPSEARYDFARAALDGPIAEMMLAKVVYQALRYDLLPHAEQVYGRFAGEFPQSAYRALLQAAYEREKHLAPGNQAPDFKLTDAQGRQVSLADFKGKVVYLDFWASWCAPCLRDIPKAQQLNQQLNGRDVVFLSVSIDEDERAWRQTLEQKQMGGVHLISKGWDSAAAQLYNIRGVPSYFIIGKDGKILHNPAKRPGNPEALNDLEKALYPSERAQR